MSAPLVTRWQVVDRHLSFIGGALREREQAYAEAQLYDRSHSHRAPHQVLKLLGFADGVA